MKHAHLVRSAVALLALTSCGGQSSPASAISESSCHVSEPCSSSEPTKMAYGHYTLKSSVKDLSEIEGYPWINSNIPGMLGKVEKPEAKHDFFGHANYEDFTENPLPEGVDRSGGKIMESKSFTENSIKEIFNGDNADVQAILRLLKTGAKDKIRESVADLLDPETSASAAKSLSASKAIFQGNSRLVTAEIDESGKVHVSFLFSAQNFSLSYFLYLAQTTKKATDYRLSLAAYLKLLGIDEEQTEKLFLSAIGTAMNAILAIAEASLDDHETTLGQMNFDFGSIDLKSALLDLGLGPDTQVVLNDQAYRYLTSVGSISLEALAEYLALSKLFDSRFFIGASDYRDLFVNHFASLQGFESAKYNADSSDDEVARALYLEAFPKAFDQVYIDKFVKPSTKQRIDDLIGDIIDEYQILFDEQEWLGEETKQAAKDKLSNMWHMSFYGDGFMDEDKLFKVTATDAFGLAEDYYDWYAGILASCPWSGNILVNGTSTTTVNAAYSTSDNAFAIYHGVCSSYIEEENLSTEQLYGYIGVVIGHEISHGFDSTGANFDKNGKKHDWWTAEDRASFQGKVNKIADYYTNYLHGFHDHNYDGANLTGEVIADMGGVRVMLRLAEKQESFNYDEFFRAFADNFAIQATRDFLIKRIATDIHPEEYLRINVTLSQFDEFLKTYDVKPGDGMYVAPEDRLAIW